MSRIEVWLSLVEHYVRDVGAASSNLVTSTIEKARSFGKFPVAACFVLFGGSLKFVRHFKSTRKSRTEYNKKPPPKAVLRGGFHFMPARCLSMS